MLRTGYLAAGLAYVFLFCIILGLILGGLHPLFLPIIKKFNRKLPKSKSLLPYTTALATLALISGIALFVALLSFYFKDINFRLFFWCLAHGAACSVAVLAYHATRRHTPRSTKRRRKIASNILRERAVAIFVGTLLVGYFGVMLVYYGQFVYHTFPQALGGGGPLEVQFTGDPELIAELRELNVPIETTTKTGKVDLLMETNSKYIVGIGKGEVPLEKSRVRNVQFFRVDFSVPPKERAKIAFNKAEEAIIVNDFGAAESLFVKARRLRNCYVVALVGQGDMYLDLDYPTDQPTQFYQRALELYKLAVDCDNKNISAYYGLARAEARLDNKTRAIDNLVLAHSNNDEQLQEILRDSEFNHIKSDEDFISRFFGGSESAAATKYYDIAEEFFKDGVLRNARQHYRLAQILDDTELRNPNFYHSLAILEFEDGNLDAAIEQLSTAIEADKQQTAATQDKINLEYYFLIGNAYQTKASRMRGIDAEEYRRSAQFSYAVIELKESDISNLRSFLTERGKLYLDLIPDEQNAIGHARNGFKEAKNAGDSSGKGSTAIVLFHEARSFAITEDWTKALSSLKSLLRQDPTYWMRVSREPVFSGLDGDDRFAKYLQQAKSTALTTDAATDKYEEGGVLAREGRIGEALEAYRAAVQYDIKNEKYRFRLAKAFNAMGQKDAAAREYERATSLNTGYALAYCNLAELYESMHKQENARTNWALCLHLSADSDTKIWAKRALEQLNALLSS